MSLTVLLNSYHKASIFVRDTEDSLQDAQPAPSVSVALVDSILGLSQTTGGLLVWARKQWLLFKSLPLSSSGTNPSTCMERGYM
jgi:hypothetical protein